MEFYIEGYVASLGLKKSRGEQLVNYLKEQDKKHSELQEKLKEKEDEIAELFGVLKVVFYSTVKKEENPISEWDKFLERNNYKEKYEQLKQKQ